MKYHPLTEKIKRINVGCGDEVCMDTVDQTIRTYLKEKAEQVNSGAYQNMAKLLDLQEPQRVCEYCGDNMAKTQLIGKELWEKCAFSDNYKIRFGFEMMVAPEMLEGKKRKKETTIMAIKEIRNQANAFFEKRLSELT